MTLTAPQWLLRRTDSVCVQWGIDLLGKTICQKAMWCREQRKAPAADPSIRINPILLRFVIVASPMSSHNGHLLQKQGCELNTAWCLESLDPKEWSWAVFCGCLDFSCLHASGQMWILCPGISCTFASLPWAGFSHVVLRVVLQSTLSSRATLQLPAYLFIVWGGKTFPCGQWLIQPTCAHWLGVDGNLTHALHHDLKQSSLPELGGQYRFCNVLPIGPTTHFSPQPSRKSLDFRVEEADVKQHCLRCTGDSDDSSWEDGSWQQRELAVCEGHFCWCL